MGTTIRLRVTCRRCRELVAELYRSVSTLDAIDATELWDRMAGQQSYVEEQCSLHICEDRMAQEWGFLPDNRELVNTIEPRDRLAEAQARRREPILAARQALRQEIQAEEDQAIEEAIEALHSAREPIRVIRMGD